MKKIKETIQFVCALLFLCCTTVLDSAFMYYLIMGIVSKWFYIPVAVNTLCLIGIFIFGSQGGDEQ